MLSAVQSGKTGPWLERLSQGQILVLMIPCLLASSSGRVPQKVTGHARSHLEGPSSRASTTVISTHPPLYSWWNTPTWLTLGILKSAKLPLSFLVWITELAGNCCQLIQVQRTQSGLVAREAPDHYTAASPAQCVFLVMSCTRANCI